MFSGEVKVAGVDGEENDNPRVILGGYDVSVESSSEERQCPSVMRLGTDKGADYSCSWRIMS